jgi:hypothetical protein
MRYMRYPLSVISYPAPRNKVSSQPSMRFLFTSAPMPGHLDWGGYLATAAMLAARGHDLLWVSAVAVESQVRAAGVPFLAIAETGWRWPPAPPLPRGVMAADVWAAQRAQRAMDQWLDIDRVAQATAELASVANAFAPDLIVTEHFVAAAALVAEQSGRRLVVAGWPAWPRRLAATPVQAALANEFRARLAAWGSKGHYFTKSGPPGIESPYLHITWWSRGWYGTSTESFGAQTRHVGGSASDAKPPPSDMPDPRTRPWIFITLGTAFNRDPAFFAAAVHAAHAVGAQPIVATGPLAPTEDTALRYRLPASAMMRQTVDFTAVLPHCAAAIHHGGAGTTHALVTHAIPQIVVPHAGDQMQQALGVARTAIGMHIPPAEVTTERLTTALEQLLSAEAPARANARRLRAEFAALGGAQSAAHLLEAEAHAAHNSG